MEAAGRWIQATKTSQYFTSLLCWTPILLALTQGIVAPITRNSRCELYVDRLRGLLGIVPPRLLRVLRLPLTEVVVPTRDGPVNFVNLLGVIRLGMCGLTP